VYPVCLYCQQIPQWLYFGNTLIASAAHDFERPTFIYEAVREIAWEHQVAMQTGDAAELYSLGIKGCFESRKAVQRFWSLGDTSQARTACSSLWRFGAQGGRRKTATPRYGRQHWGALQAVSQKQGSKGPSRSICGANPVLQFGSRTLYRAV